MTGTEDLFLAPQLPPLLRPRPVDRRIDPFFKAIAAGEAGEEPGLVIHAEDLRAMRLAVLLAPESPLADAVGAQFAASLGLADALGALGPPELAVHFAWPNRILVNRAEAGRLRVASSTTEAEAVPGWLVFALDVALARKNEDPGLDPAHTTLEDEGCIGLSTPRLIESWSRHFLVWLNRFMDEGLRPLHGAWCARCMEIGKPLEERPAGLDLPPSPPPLFLGLDERGGMLLRQGDDTILLPLHEQLDYPR